MWARSSTCSARLRTSRSRRPGRAPASRLKRARLAQPPRGRDGGIGLASARAALGTRLLTPSALPVPRS
eukprot:1967945-Pyramimonas_sp.AAC.1